MNGAYGKVAKVPPSDSSLAIYLSWVCGKHGAIMGQKNKGTQRIRYMPLVAVNVFSFAFVFVVKIRKLTYNQGLFSE